MKSPRILLGGVPFGKDNVGDEAIVESIVSIVRGIWPEADIWVSTGDQEGTALKLKVRTVPLFGFDRPGCNRKEILEALDSVDAFVWAGATGLSDYPEIPLELLLLAIDRNKKTVIFCTGMNAHLNPYLYRLMPGPRLRVFSLVHRLSFGSIDLVERYEARNRHRAEIMMRQGVESAGLVILRDKQSLDAMKKVLDEVKPSILVGADPAIEITPKPIENVNFPRNVKEICRRKNQKIGLCLSAQGPVRQLDELAALFDRLVNDLGIHIIGIPMNPITDAELMTDFRRRLNNPQAMCVAEGRFEPDEIAGLASEMDVVISSRLHLLILASISLTPFIGISRGSKIANFTSQFQLPEVGSVEALDLALLENEIFRLLSGREEFETKARAVRAEMLERLSIAKVALSGHLSAT